MATVSKLMVPFVETMEDTVCRHETHIVGTRKFPTSKSAHDLCLWGKGRRYIQSRTHRRGWAKPRSPRWAGKESTLTSFTVQMMTSLKLDVRSNGLACNGSCAQRESLETLPQMAHPSGLHTRSNIQGSETKLLISCKQCYPRGQLSWKEVANVFWRVFWGEFGNFTSAFTPFEPVPWWFHCWWHF